MTDLDTTLDEILGGISWIKEPGHADMLVERSYDEAKTALKALLVEARIDELMMWDAAQKAGTTHRSSLAYRIAELKRMKGGV